MKCPIKGISTEIWYDCIEEECQIWDNKNGRCGIIDKFIIDLYKTIFEIKNSKGFSLNFLLDKNL